MTRMLVIGKQTGGAQMKVGRMIQIIISRRSAVRLTGCQFPERLSAPLQNLSRETECR